MVATIEKARDDEDQSCRGNGWSRKTDRPASANRPRRRAQKGLNARHRKRGRHRESEQAQEGARPGQVQRAGRAGTSAGLVKTALVATHPRSTSQ